MLVNVMNLCFSLKYQQYIVTYTNKNANVYLTIFYDITGMIQTFFPLLSMLNYTFSKNYSEAISLSIFMIFFTSGQGIVSSVIVYLDFVFCSIKITIV